MYKEANLLKGFVYNYIIFHMDDIV